MSLNRLQGYQINVLIILILLHNFFFVTAWPVYSCLRSASGWKCKGNHVFQSKRVSMWKEMKMTWVSLESWWRAEELPNRFLRFWLFLSRTLYVRRSVFVSCLKNNVAIIILWQFCVKYVCSDYRKYVTCKLEKTY